MIALFESGGFRLTYYLLAAIGALLTARSSSRATRTHPATAWPMFWIVAASAMAALGIARGTFLSGFVTDAVRRVARSTGLYDFRAPYQRLAMLALMAGWVVVSIVLIQKISPAVRARLMPAAAAIVAVVVFAASRFVSLHHYDSLLDRRDITGIRLGALIEVALVGLVIATTRMANRQEQLQSSGPGLIRSTGTLPHGPRT